MDLPVAYSSNMLWLRKAAAVVRLFRIGNCLALGILFVSARRHFAYNTDIINELLLAVTWVLLAAFANGYNDFCDIEIDRINKPNRPLPSGVLTPRFVKVTLWVTGIIIVILAITIWGENMLWPLWGLISGWIYSRFLLPKTAFGSNLAASFGLAAVPLSGLPLLENLRIWALAAGIIMVMFAREVQKDAQDIKGDAYFRPRALLIGKYSRIFEFIYPALLVAGGILLQMAILTYPGSLSNTVLSFLPVITLGLALLIFVCQKNNHRLQVNITKVTSYLVAVILMFS